MPALVAQSVRQQLIQDSLSEHEQEHEAHSDDMIEILRTNMSLCTCVYIVWVGATYRNLIKGVFGCRCTTDFTKRFLFGGTQPNTSSTEATNSFDEAFRTITLQVEYSSD